MVEDDIYGNKEKYLRFKNNYKALLKKPPKKGKSKYYCKNFVNLKYFERLFAYFELKDLSFIRRNRVIGSMKFIVYSFNKNLKKCERIDINKIMPSVHRTFKTPRSKETFIRDFKLIFKILFPESDEKGRIDETLTPYVVRHISDKIDKSQERLRQDRLTWDDFENILNYFASDPRIQAYLTISFESLRRPQELLDAKIGGVELYDNYAKIYGTRGKEGPVLIQCIDSYPYLIKWLEVHPLKNDKNASYRHL